MSFLAEAQLILERLQDAAERARAVHQGTEGRIEVGLSDSHFMGPLPHVIAQYCHTYPNVAIQLNEMKPVDQVHALMERRIDVAISRIPVDDTIRRSVALWPDPVVVAFPKGHALAGRQKIRIKDLANEKLVALRRETSLFAQTIYERHLSSSTTAAIVQTVSEVPAQIYLVAAGLGVAVVPLSVCTRFKEVDWCPLDEPDIRTDVYGIVRRDARKQALKKFVNFIRKEHSIPIHKHEF